MTTLINEDGYIYVGKYYDKNGNEVGNKYKKIGKTIDASQRSTQLNATDGPIGVELVKIWHVSNMSQCEEALHAAFGNTRTSGEWFNDDDNTLIERVEKFMKVMGAEPRSPLFDE